MDGSSRVVALACALAVLLLGGLCGCRRFTKAAADREVYGLLAARRHQVPEVAGTLDIEAKDRLAASMRRQERFHLTLLDALALATVASREYRSAREDVYLAALSLTRELNAFRPLGRGGGRADLDLDETRTSGSGNVDGSFSRAFETGGSIVFGLATSFLRNITGDPLRAAQTILNLDFVLPMARGSGRLVAQESLRQAERDALDALRSYARFQQEFTVDVASRFYRALQLRDNWKNAELAWESLGKLVQEQGNLAGEGRIPEFEVDLARQRLLEADDSRQRARNRYENAVDAFKLDLGVPVAADVALDDSDLEQLRQRGPQPAPYDQARGALIAQTRRLDLTNGRAQEVDARRRIAIARDALGAQVDLRLGGDLSTPAEQPFNLRRATPSVGFGLDVDLPLERTAERNDFRRAILQANRARRARERLEDLVALQVRDAYRNLTEAQRSYVIQLEGAKLAERRVEQTTLLLELGGRATIRDRLEAEDARVRTRDAVTAALVDHALARLALERDVGTLRVDAQGMWTATPVPDPAAAALSVLGSAPAQTLGSAPGFPPPPPPPPSPPGAPRAATTVGRP